MWLANGSKGKGSGGERTRSFFEMGMVAGLIAGCVFLCWVEGLSGRRDWVGGVSPRTGPRGVRCEIKGSEWEFGEE